jgi:hypothetical protein
MDYRQYLSFEQFCEYFPEKHINNIYHEAGVTKERRPNFMGDQKANFIEFFIQKTKEKDFTHIVNSETHTTRVAREWKEFIAHPEMASEQRDKFIRNFLNPMIFNLALGNPEIYPELADARYCYDTIIDNLNSGNFHANLGENCFLMEDHYCFECGCNMKLIMENWQPTFKIEKHDNKQDFLEQEYFFVNPEPCIEDKIQSFDFEIKGNELLAADWFRFDAFTQATDTNFRFNINSPKGQIDETLFYAKEFNFIKITMGNMTVDLFNHNGNIVAGDKIKETVPKAYQEVGSVCCELWAVSMIEPQTLAEIIAKQDNLDIEKARQMVEDYVKAGGADRISVEPGHYTVKFGNNYARFESLAREDETIGWKTKAIEPYFMLQKKLPENILVNDNTGKKKPKM